MLSLLAFHDLTESELAELLKVGKLQVRKQLTVLRSAGAVCWKATGSHVYY